MLFRGLLHDDTVNSEGDDGRRKRSNSDSNRHHHHRQSNSNNNTRRRKPALRTTTVRSANEAFESHPSSPTSVFSVRSLPGGTREAPTSSSSHPQRLHSLHSPEGALRFPSSPLAWMTSPSSSDSTRSQQGPTSSGETSPINMQIVTSGKGNADGGLAPPHPRSPPESLRSTSGGGGGGVDHADRRSVSFVDQPRQSMEHSAASDYDDFDDDGSESWQTSSTISMSATSHAWIQDLVRLSRNLSRRRAILFLLRRIGNNVPPKAINIFSMAISFSALAPDVKERLRFLGIRNHLHLINLIIIARLVYSFLLAILVMSIVLLCVFTLREDDRSRFISLKTLFSLDAVCVIIFTIEILFHVNSIPSWADRQALHNSRSSGMKKGSSSYPWFILMLRPTLKNSASTVATLAVLDSMGNNPLREQPPAANPSEVHLNIPTSPNDPTLLNVPNAATSPLTSSQIQAHFASMAPHVAAAVEAGGMIKHHSLADPGWLWLIFDCLSTFPFYIEITFATLYTNNGLDAAITNMYGWTGLPPALWILRLFRIFRVFKFLEKSEKMKVMTRAFIHSMDGIWLLLILLPILLVLFSFGIFFAEQTGEYLDENGFWRYRTDDVFSPFQNVPDTFWFVIVTLTTIGYGDVTPRTLAGRLVAVMVMFCSIFIIAFPLSMITMQYAHVVRAFADRSRRQEELTYRLHHRLITQNMGEALAQEVEEMGHMHPSPKRLRSVEDTDEGDKRLQTAGSDATLQNGVSVPLVRVDESSERKDDDEVKQKKTEMNETGEGSSSSSLSREDSVQVPEMTQIRREPHEPGANDETGTRRDSFNWTTINAIVMAQAEGSVDSLESLNDDCGGSSNDGGDERDDQHHHDHNDDGGRATFFNEMREFNRRASPDIMADNGTEEDGILDQGGSVAESPEHGIDPPIDASDVAFDSLDPARAKPVSLSRLDDDLLHAPPKRKSKLLHRSSTAPTINLIVPDSPSTDGNNSSPSQWLTDNVRSSVDSLGSGLIVEGNSSSPLPSATSLDDMRVKQSDVDSDSANGTSHVPRGGSIRSGSPAHVEVGSSGASEMTVTAPKPNLPSRLLYRFQTSPNLIPKLGRNLSFGHMFQTDDIGTEAENSGDAGSNTTQQDGSTSSAPVYGVRGGVFTPRGNPLHRRSAHIPLQPDTAPIPIRSQSPQHLHHGSTSTTNSISLTPSSTRPTPMHQNSVASLPATRTATNSTVTSSRKHHHHHNSLSVRDVERAFESVRDHDLVPVVHIRVADWRAEYREDRREDVLHMRMRCKDEDQYKRLMRMLQEFQ